MRISDWSSDVCSSDLGTFGLNVVEGTVLTSLKNDKETFCDTRLDHRPDSSEEGYGGSLRIDQDVGFAVLVSVYAFRKSDGVYRTDLDYSGQTFYNADQIGRASCRERLRKYE